MLLLTWKQKSDDVCRYVLQRREQIWKVESIFIIIILNLDSEIEESRLSSFSPRMSCYCSNTKHMWSLYYVSLINWVPQLLIACIVCPSTIYSTSNLSPPFEIPLASWEWYKWKLKWWRGKIFSFENKN
jgi:hypothetical protein